MPKIPSDPIKADQALDVLDHYLSITDQSDLPLQTQIACLLVDLIHLCERKGLPFGDVLRDACAAYSEEGGEPSISENADEQSGMIDYAALYEERMDEHLLEETARETADQYAERFAHGQAETLAYEYASLYDKADPDEPLSARAHIYAEKFAEKYAQKCAEIFANKYIEAAKE